MILQDYLTGVVQSRAYRCQLDQHLGAILALFHHALYLFQVADGPGKAVNDRFLVFVDMAVGMGDAVGMHIGMVVFVIMMVVMGMVCHGKASLWLLFPYHIPFFENLQAPEGDGIGFAVARPAAFCYNEKNRERGEGMNRPIGVFDSGVGGISVLKELVRSMPGEDFLYFGDSVNAPYGSRSTEEVRQLTMAAAEMLFSRDCKALVVACNTATAAAIRELREKYPDRPIIGIEPALKMAADRFPEGRIGIMATEVTLREEKLASQIERFPKAEVIRIPAPGLVQLVEAGKAESPEAQALLENILAPWKDKLDALVLGCTHYPFVKKLLAQILGDGVQLLDGGEGTARRTRALLEQAGLLREGTGSVQMENSLQDGRILALSMQLLEE